MNRCGLSVYVLPELYDKLVEEGGKTEAPGNEKTELIVAMVLEMVYGASDMLEHKDNSARGITLALRINELNVGLLV